VVRTFGPHGALGLVPVQHVPLGDRECPGEQHAEDAGHHDVGVHLRVLARAGVLRHEDALADAGSAADQLGDDVDDQRDRHGDAQAGGDERGGAGQDHHEEPAGAAHPQHRRGVPDDRVEGADAVADLDDQRPEHGERDERELHRERRAPQHQAGRQDRDHRDGLEELDHADHRPVGEPVQRDEGADQERGGDADRQPDRPAFQRLPHRGPQRGRRREAPQRGRRLRHGGELIAADGPRRAQPLPEAERGGEDGEP
jgi:hypothetical protein